MSLQSLYNIRAFQNAEGDFSALISFDPAHEIFSGHFPGRPIVPGVCLIHMMKEVAGLISAQEMTLNAGVNVKFLHVIEPGMMTEVKLKGTFSANEENGLSLSAQIYSEDIVIFKFKGNFTVS